MVTILRWHDPNSAPSSDFAATAIPNGLLDRSKVPNRLAGWEDIEEFALTYDGYAYWQDVATLANEALASFSRDGALPESLDAQRACLFYEQRRWHRCAAEPTDRSRRFVLALVDAIREHLSRAHSQELAS